MEAELICKGLWDNVQCEVSVEGKPAQEPEEIVMKWHGKRKKMGETCAEIILRVEDSQLAHIHGRNLEILWGNLLQVHRAQGLVRFAMGILRVGFSHTIPEPPDTTPV